ncbi:MAG: hypothetical protein AB7O13_03625 [Alphaproteobacteria bacterium]
MDDILDANPRQGTQPKSRLERLIDVAGTNLEILSDAANELEARQPPHVAAFFQLPYHLQVEPTWHRVATLEHGLYADLRFEPCAVEPADAGNFKLIRETTQQKRQRLARVTQVIALLPVWGRRSLFHQKYLHQANSGRSDNPIIVPQRESWIDNRPLSRGEYESNFASRLIRELMTAMRVFLPAYSVRALQEAPVPKLLYSYHTMIAPGHLVYAGDNVPILGALMESAEDSESVDYVSGAEISTAMQMRYRDLSRFEQQLFALERMRRGGEVTLALIGCLSLLEWLLNLYIIGKGGKKAKLFEALRHPVIDFLSNNEKEILDDARQARNLAVHERPLTHTGLTGEDTSSGRELRGISAGLTASEVRTVMQIVFKAFREINLRGISTR